MTTPEPAAPVWIESFLHWLTPRRLRAQAIVLALCLWGVCAVDFATPGLFDRAGNIKFQDFLPFYISAHLIAQHREALLYDRGTQQKELEEIVGTTRAEVPYLYGPQVALLFIPLVSLPFAAAAGIWVVISVLIYFGCLYLLWKHCRALDSGPASRARNSSVKLQFLLPALAFPPLFHVFVRGQISALILLCFTAAYLAFQSNRPWLAGIALGFLILKPQFLLAVPLILLFARTWKSLSGLLLSAAGQLASARLYFGATVMEKYFDLLIHPQRWLSATELSLAPIQMHSLRAFWTLLIPSQTIAFSLYAVTSLLTIALAAAIWRSHASLALRFSALIVATILVNPHLFIYDLLILAPALLLIVNWCLANRQQKLSSCLLALCYLAFVLLLFGPLSRWTHLQLSVIVFATLLWTLFCFPRTGELASPESLVV